MSSDSIASVKKTLQLIDIMSKHNGMLSVTQLAGALDCSISSANRFLQTMMEIGYVEKNPISNRYHLTNRIFRISFNMLSGNDSLQKMITIAHSVSQKYDVSVNINTMDGLEPMLLFRVSPHYNRDIDYLIGKTVPAYCSSAGKAMLSLYSNDELEKYFFGLEPMKFQSRDFTVESVRQEIMDAGRLGYATHLEDFVSGVFCISFPTKDRNGHIYCMTLITTMRNRKRIHTTATIDDIRSRLSELKTQ